MKIRIKDHHKQTLHGDRHISMILWHLISTPFKFLKSKISKKKGEIYE